MPSKIQYCSDLHLEMPLNAQFMKKYPLQVSGTILILAGDIVPFAQIDRHQDFFDLVSANYEQVYWVPGNHEYYHSDITQRSGVVNEQIRSNVWLVNNTSVLHGDVALIFSTLWSKIDPVHEWQIERAMSDFHVIAYDSCRYSIRVYNELHKQCLAFIEQALVVSAAKYKVVATHHVPTFMNYPPKYKSDLLSQAFGTELHDLIASSDIHSWIYGHHHSNVADFKIGKTTLRTNQLGYVKHGEHTSFDKSKVISV